MTPEEADERRQRREVILAQAAQRPPIGRSAVLRRSLVVVYARAIRTQSDPPALGE